MAIYLGNKKVSLKSGYGVGSNYIGMDTYFKAGGKCAYSSVMSFTDMIHYNDTSTVYNMDYILTTQEWQW